MFTGLLKGTDEVGLSVIQLQVISKERYQLATQAYFRKESPKSEANQTLPAASFTIGRSPDCDWLIEDPTRFLSAQHALITLKNHQYFITDLSSNGTFRNGRQLTSGIEDSIPLHHDEQIILGQLKVLVQIELDQKQALATKDSTLINHKAGLNHLDTSKNTHEVKGQAAKSYSSRSIEDRILADYPTLDHGALLNKLESSQTHTDYYSDQVVEFPAETPLDTAYNMFHGKNDSESNIENENENENESESENQSNIESPSQAINSINIQAHKPNAVDPMAETTDPLLKNLLTQLLIATQTQLLVDAINDDSQPLQSVLNPDNPFARLKDVQQLIQELKQISSQPLNHAPAQPSMKKIFQEVIQYITHQ